jgi:peptide/nickel transport system ATP-binding protein
LTDAPRTARRVLTAPAAQDGPLLVVDDFRTHFNVEDGTVKAVDGVTFSLERGKTLGVVGESGSGKTVLARSLMGLLTARNVVRTGSATYAGQEVVGASNSQMRALWGTEMAMVFQDPMTSLNPVMKIGRQITEGLRYHLEMPKDEAEENALQLLTSVGIPDPKRRLKQYPHELSGGMRQRVTIAIALACGPKLLFADEPTTALDVTVQAQILNLLNDQQRDRHMAMVLVTHDLGVVAGRTDEIAVMYAGQIVEKAPTRRLFSSVRMPYTEALLKSIPKLEQPSHTRLQIIGGRPPDLVNPPPGCRFAPRCPYAQPKCHTDMPPLIEAESPGHVYRCWFPVGTEAGREALERNLAHHVPAAEAAVTGDSAAAAAVEEAGLLIDAGGEA